MILVLMAEGDVVTTIIIDDDEGNKMSEYVQDYNNFSSWWYIEHEGDKYEECPDLLEWLDRYKNVTTAPINVGVVSIVDGYWYT
jgi:hypothetical protein